MDKRKAASRRVRSTKRTTPRVRVEPGAKQESFVPGLVPATIKRSAGRVEIKLVSTAPTNFGSFSEVDATIVASHLARDLHVLLRQGAEISVDGYEPVGERLRPILALYAGVMDKDHARHVSFAFADVALRTASGKLKPSEALKQSRAIRGERIGRRMVGRRSMFTMSLLLP